MAARTATKTRRTTKKAAPLEEDLDEDLEDEVEDEDTEDEEEEAPAPKSRRGAAAKKAPAKKAAPKAAAKSDVLGSAWLKEHVNETLGSEHESTKLRIVLRKLIKDGTIDSPKDGRYQFSGPKDPAVRAVIKALRDEAKAGPAKRGRKAKTKVVDEVEEDDEVEDLDLDDE